jgi:hypothetical protein
MSPDDAKRKRARAIQMLRSTGMTDAEIERELAKHGLSTTRNESDAQIIDAEIVSEESSSNDEAMIEPVAHLPAVILNPSRSPNEQDGGRDWSKSSVPQRRCKAHKKDGEQCKNAALRGATVCRYHGGAAKHVKMAARARLENATDRLAKELLGMAIDPTATPAVKLAAIRDALDRGGLRPPNEVVLSQGSTAFDEVFDGIYSGPADEYLTDSSDSQDDSAYSPPPDDSAEDGTYQANSSHCESQPASVDGDAGNAREWFDRPRRQRDCDRPASTQPSERERGDRYHRRSFLTGEDAIAEANRANAEIGALRALPPGRSR